MNNKKLIELAIEAKKNSYAKYSNFRVGASLLGESGQVYLGCNVENATYGATNCAERTAVFSGIASGEKKFTKVAIVSSSGEYTYPCGICRQVLFEFMGDDGIVILGDKDGNIKEHTIKELLPYGFKL